MLRWLQRRQEAPRLAQAERRGRSSATASPRQIARRASASVTTYGGLGMSRRRANRSAGVRFRFALTRAFPSAVREGLRGFRERCRCWSDNATVDAVDQNAFTTLKRLDVFGERDVAGIAAVCVGYHPMSDHCFLLSRARSMASSIRHRAEARNKRAKGVTAIHLWCGGASTAMRVLALDGREVHSEVRGDSKR
jgi:hypothetical protein